MFLAKLFRKDYRHYQSQGEKHLAAERFADARCAFQEALERCPAEAQGDRAALAEGAKAAGNGLARLNLAEAQGARNSGDLDKARDHFSLALELADDVQLREIAEKELNALPLLSQSSLSDNNSKHSGHSGSCSSCKGHGSEPSEDQGVTSMGLSTEDTFHLLVQPLPGDLPARYGALGKKFAEAYLLIHEGNDRAALPILQELHRNSESDVVMYELALIMFRAGRPGECRELLDRALAANPSNPLCYLSLVQLAMGGERYSDALAVLSRMQELEILPDQIPLMLGDVHAAAGDHEAALAHLSEALAFPATARPAAERVVPLLTSLGRQQEAQFVAKKYLKGCC